MTFIEQLCALVGQENVLSDKENKAYAELDSSTNVKASSPFLVVKITSEDQLITATRLCLENRISLVVRGAGSGKSGGAVASADSVVLDITGLNRILSIDTANLLAEVEPGVILGDLKRAVLQSGLFYPPDPASTDICTIGGNVAENAAGPSTLKYGSTRDYVLGGRAILGTGEIIDFGKRCPKGVAGYDIGSLLCGSEGTLAVFLRFTLRLLPKPQDQAAALFYFSDEKLALDAVNGVLNAGHLPKTLEYVDSSSLLALQKLTACSVPEHASALLIVECDASFPKGAEQQLTKIIDTIQQYGLVATVVASNDIELGNLWQLRGKLSEACSKFLGHKLSEDIAVPLGRIADFGEAIRTMSKPPHLVTSLFGHAGDGNLHVQIMFDHERYRNDAEATRHEILLLVIKLGGTLTAEHGIGLQKKAYLPLEQSAALIELQKRIKNAFDPYNLLNPGKIFDP